MSRPTVGWCIAFVLLLAQPVARAQMPVQPGGPNVMTTILVKLFGSNTAFTAKADFRVLNKEQKETDLVPMGFAMSDAKMRLDIDMNQMKSADMSQFLPTFRQLGMDQIVVITRPDHTNTLSIYPKAKSYAEIKLTKDEATVLARNYKLDRSPLGKEIIDGHNCEHQKVALTTEKGEKGEAEVWNASDLKDFPVQVRMTYPDSTVLIKFKDVKLSRPDAKLFEAPAGLTKYDSAEALRDFLISKGPGGTAAKK